MEVELETNPKGREGFNRTKLHTKGQLYLYANLELAKTLVLFAGRVTKEMAKNQDNMVQRAPPQIRYVIESGKQLDDKLNARRDQARKEQDELDKYKKPKTDLDIFLRAPKIILYEGLLGESILKEGQADAILVDLGQIEI